jgi:Xaa-Pro aminopeptidase
MVKRAGKVTEMLFTEPKDPAREVWSGERLGAAGVLSLTGIEGRRLDALKQALDSLLQRDSALYVVGNYSERRDILSREDQFVAAVRENHPKVVVRSANGTVDRLRGRKSPAELALLRKSIEITVEAHKRAMAEAVRPDGYEYEAQALIEYVFRSNGADRPSFASIVGSGPNATTLHYNRDDRQMKAGEVVVMDVGSSYRGYAADVTRTVPVSGRFTDAMKEVYQIVRDAQSAAERQAAPGAEARLMSDSATAVIAAGLARLGLIESARATYDCGAPPQPASQKCPQFQLYYMHGLGHGIGLDVHDPEQFYFTGRIGEGSAFTIEPGIYVRANLLEIIPDSPANQRLKSKIAGAVKRYASIGIRIEDDYLVTDKGVEWVSRAPREIAEIEAIMRSRVAQ